MAFAAAVTAIVTASSSAATTVFSSIPLVCFGVPYVSDGFYIDPVPRETDPCRFDITGFINHYVSCESTVQISLRVIIGDSEAERVRCEQEI